MGGFGDFDADGLFLGGGFDCPCEAFGAEFQYAGHFQMHPRALQTTARSIGLHEDCFLDGLRVVGDAHDAMHLTCLARLHSWFFHGYLHARTGRFDFQHVDRFVCVIGEWQIEFLHRLGVVGGK